MSKTGILKSTCGSSKTLNKVQFRIPFSLKTTLSEYVKGQDKRLYEETVSSLRDYDVLDDDLLQLLKEVRSVLSILDKRVKFFVRVFLHIPWAHRSGPVVEEYQAFLLDLLVAHNYYIDISFEILVHNFRKVDPSAGEDDAVPTDLERNISGNVHKVLADILKVIPLSKELLIEQCKMQYPYVRRPAREQELYLGNMLTLARHQPSLRASILGIIITKMILLDVNSPLEDIEAMEDEDDDPPPSDNMDAVSTVTSLMGGPLVRRVGGNGMRHPLANTLDCKMLRLISYINKECTKNVEKEQDNNSGECFFIDSLGELTSVSSNSEAGAMAGATRIPPSPEEVDWIKCRCLYDDLRDVFSRLILPTYGSHHVQFLIFYLVAGGIQDAKGGERGQQWLQLTDSFLELLWRKASNPNVAPVERVAVLSYLASFLARSKLMPHSMIKAMLSEMCCWIHSYIGRQEYTECGALTMACANRNHSVFHSVCHTLFYVIAFRHVDLSKSSQDIAVLQSFNLSRIVTSALNPLKTCPANIANRFSSVVASLQLAYCATVMEANARETLPVESSCTQSSMASFFPFDRYVLSRSEPCISPLFLEYQGVEEDQKDVDGDTDEEFDDFLDESMTNIRRRVRDVSMSEEVYGTSPGLMDLS